jgi:flagellar basal body-associated protein FliL
MKKYLHPDTLRKLKYRASMKGKITYQFCKACYQKLNKKQRTVLFSSNGLIALLLIVFGSSSIFVSNSQPKTDYPVKFETKAAVKQQAHQIVSRLKVESASQNNNAKLQAELNSLKVSSSAELQALRSQLQSMQSDIGSLASQQNIQQLQQAVAKPNKALLGKIDTIQNSVQTIIKQTAKKIWVNPQTIRQYFRLVAVQGFSDGMRAIIDVDGNQATLSVNETCPACRGWALQSMDFANQTAVFSKQANHQTLYVRLHAN